MKCLVCNRTLKNPKSIERGIGPVCEGRLSGKKVKVKRAKKEKKQLEMFK